MDGIDFFMLSSYGLVKTLKNKNVSFKTYLHKRIKKVYFPYFLINIIVILLCGFNIPTFNTANPVATFLSSPGLWDYFCYMSGLKMIDSILWFVNLQLFCYIIIFILFKVVKNNFLLVLSSFIIVALYILIAIYLQWGSYTYVGILGFPIGVFWATYENEIKINSKIIRLIIITLLLLTIIWCISIQDNSSFFVKYISCYLLIIWSCLAIYILKDSMLSRNFKSLAFLGAISYEFYLVHMKVISFFHTRLLVITDSIIYNPLFLMIISILLAYALNFIISSIYKISERT